MEKSPKTARASWICPNLGLRHRAAVGMSEITDTMVVVVSEETGQISLTFNGKLVHNVSLTELRSSINEYLSTEEAPKIVEPSSDTPSAEEISPKSSVQTEPST